jgi:hypothetical protein
MKTYGGVVVQIHVFLTSARTSEENVNRIREAFQRSPRKSIRAANLHLRTNSTFNSPRCATQKASPKSVAYNIHIIHALKPNGQVAGINFAVDMLERIDAHPTSSVKCASRTRRRSMPVMLSTGTTAGFGAVNIHMSHMSWSEAATS